MDVAGCSVGTGTTQQCTRLRSLINRLDVSDVNVRCEMLESVVYEWMAGSYHAMAYS